MARDKARLVCTVQRSQVTKFSRVPQVFSLKINQEGAVSKSQQDNRTEAYQRSQANLDRVKAQYNNTISTLQKQLEQERSVLNQLREVRPVDVAEAQAEVDYALSQVKQIESELEDYYVRVPIDGQILKINTLVGEQVNTSQGIVELGRTDRMYAIAEVYETDVGMVEVGDKADVAVLAFDPARPVLNLPDVNQQIDRIKLPDKVLVDRQARPDLGAIAQAFDNGETVTTEISGRRISVSGMFDFGSTLFVEGFLITSDWNYLRLYGADSIENVKVGVLNIDSGENPATVKARVKASLPDIVSVMTHEEFVAAEKEFWDENHPAGTIFNFGVAMGFVVGVVIVYQVLFADVNDHLAEYATLKAMGFPDKSLLVIVFQEAIILAVLGFIPGFGVSIGMYALLESLTQMPLAMGSEVAAIFVLTVTMCLVSSAIAIRKLQSADPAEVF